MLRVPAALVAAVLVVPAPAPAADPAPPKVSARAAAAFDVVSGRFLYRFNATAPLPPASLAKMLVALLVAEHLSPTDTVPITRNAATKRPDNIRWPEGATHTADDLLHAMMLESSNGAAVAFAERIAGSVDAFTTMMNERAASLGARNTRIVDPSGLDAPGQVSTAQDLALIAAAVVREPWPATVVNARSRTIPWTDGGSYRLHTFNGFVARYREAIGVKNGFTSQAGNCLAAAAQRAGRTVVAVVLDDRRWYADTTALMDYGFPRAVPGPLTPLPRPASRAQPQVAEQPPAVPEPGSSLLRRLGYAFGIVFAAVFVRRRQVVARRRRRARMRARAAAAALEELLRSPPRARPSRVPQRRRTAVGS